MFTTKELRGNWNEQKVKLKRRFSSLMDHDLVFVNGKKEVMLEKLQLKLGKTKQELYVIIEAL